MSRETSYSNLGGQGNRVGIVQVLQHPAGLSTKTDPIFLIDGNKTSNNDWIRPVENGAYFQFEFLNPVIIDEVKWYQSTTATHATWQFYGSDEGSTWSKIGSSFVLGGATTQAITAISDNTKAYKFYKMEQVSGENSASPYIYEIEFKLVEYTPTVKHLIKSSNKIQSLFESTLIDLGEAPTHEMFEQYGIEDITLLNATHDKMQLAMVESRELGGGKEYRRKINIDILVSMEVKHE